MKNQPFLFYIFKAERANLFYYLWHDPTEDPTGDFPHQERFLYNIL